MPGSRLNLCQGAEESLRGAIGWQQCVEAPEMRGRVKHTPKGICRGNRKKYTVEGFHTKLIFQYFLCSMCNTYD